MNGVYTDRFAHPIPPGTRAMKPRSDRKNKKKSSIESKTSFIKGEVFAYVEHNKATNRTKVQQIGGPVTVTAESIEEAEECFIDKYEAWEKEGRPSSIPKQAPTLILKPKRKAHKRRKCVVKGFYRFSINKKSRNRGWTIKTRKQRIYARIVITEANGAKRELYVKNSYALKGSEQRVVTAAILAAREAKVIDEDASREWCLLNGFEYPDPERRGTL